MHTTVQHKIKQYLMPCPAELLMLTTSILHIVSVDLRLVKVLYE